MFEGTSEEKSKSKHVCADIYTPSYAFSPRINVMVVLLADKTKMATRLATSSCWEEPLPDFLPTTSLYTTRNPFLSTYLLVRGVYHLTVYHLHDRRVYRRCLQYLIHYRADLGIRSVERETARDIAVRMRKMALLEVIEDACMLSPLS